MQYKEIGSIKSVGARNIIRGMINSDNHKKNRKSLSKIKKGYSNKDLKDCLLVLKGNPLFEKNGISRHFNYECPKPLDYFVTYTVEEITREINFHKNKLCFFLEEINILITEIFLKNFCTAIEKIEDLISKGGVSVFLLRVLLYLGSKLDIESNHLDLDKIESILKKYYSNSSSIFLENVIKELSSHQTSYFSIYSRIEGFPKESPIYKIAKSFLKHTYESKQEFNAIINAYFSYSLLDSLLFLISSSRLLYDNDILEKTLHHDFYEKFNFIRKINLNKDIYTNISGDCNIDFAFFRDAFLLIELDVYFNYKIIHGAYYNENEVKSSNLHMFEKEIINDYFGDIKAISDIPYGIIDSSLNLDKFNKETPSLLENSTALVYLLEKNAADIPNLDEFFINAMSSTTDIGAICPLNYLKNMKLKSSNTDLILVLDCLISIKEKSNKSQHALRKIISSYCIEKFNSSMTSLIEYFYALSPEVAEHLIQICDETFLIKLFHLTDSPNEATEERAKILEWFGDKTGDNNFKDRAKNLRIDIQINKEKGTIDDSRIYVDPLKFSQWITNNIINDLTLLMTTNIDDEVGLVSINWDSLSNGILVKEQVGSLLLLCYQEFCSHKLFGIASYLGRRIRHGTFKGTGMKDIRELESLDKYGELFLNKDFIHYYQKWRDGYEKMIDSIINDYLHIKSKNKPLGLIVPNINSTFKSNNANQMYMDIYTSFLKYESNIQIPSLIIEYCWRIIEEDLLIIRKFLMEEKLILSIDHSMMTRWNVSNRLLRDFVTAINSSVADKFRVISSWFNKPSIASPSTDLILLFKAVVSEIKGLFSHFSPEIKSDAVNFPINGGQYYAIYDAFFVLIHNIADYGLPSGTIELKIERQEKFIKLLIISEVSNQVALLKAEKAINEALQADFNDAHIIEGRSGIKKLKQLEKENYIKDVKFSFGKPNKIFSSFNYAVEF